MQIIDNDAHFRALLQERGLRLTKARIVVYKLLQLADSPQSIQQIIEHSKGIHYVSIYRTIDVFLEAAIIRQVPIGFKNKYELSDIFKPHHHHVTCEVCGTNVAVNQESIERLMRHVTHAAGMEPTHHHFEAYGICNDCKSS